MTDEQHCELKLSCELQDLRGLWQWWTDKQRLEVIKSIVCMAEQPQVFIHKTLNFLEKLDID